MGGMKAMIRSQKDQTNIDALMQGAVEFHVHFAPDGLTPRKNDAFELLREAKAAGLKAVVLKNKSCGTGAIAQLANKYAHGALAIGGITLDVSVGGFNPAAVEIEAALGSKIVWMPTYSALNDPKHKKTERQMMQNSLSPIDNQGQLLPEVYEILSLIKQHNMILGTGHLSRKEIFILVEEAVKEGVKKIVVNHPLTKAVGTRLPLEDQLSLAEMGAYMDHCWVASMPKHDGLSHEEFVEAIRTVGAENCILSSDFGQVHNPTPLEGFRDMLETLFESGLTAEELEMMIKKNPKKLLDIDG